MSEPGFNDRIEVELLKKDVAIITRLCEKMDATIDKVQQVASDLSRIVSVHESKFTDQDKVNTETEKRADARADKETSDFKDLNEKIDRVKKTIDHNRTERIDSMEALDDKIHEKISHTETAILAEIQKLKADVNELSSWRYMMVGGMALFVFLFTKGSDLIKFFKG